MLHAGVILAIPNTRCFYTRCFEHHHSLSSQYGTVDAVAEQMQMVNMSKGKLAANWIVKASDDVVNQASSITKYPIHKV